MVVQYYLNWLHSSKYRWNSLCWKLSVAWPRVKKCIRAILCLASCLNYKTHFLFIKHVNMFVSNKNRLLHKCYKELTLGISACFCWQQWSLQSPRSTLPPLWHWGAGGSPPDRTTCLPGPHSTPVQVAHTYLEAGSAQLSLGRSNSSYNKHILWTTLKVSS